MRSPIRRPPAPLTFSRKELKHWARELGLNVWPYYCRTCDKVTPHHIDDDQCSDCAYAEAPRQHKERQQ